MHSTTEEPIEATNSEGTPPPEAISNRQAGLLSPLLANKWIKGALASGLLILIAGLGVGTVCYFRCAALLDHRLSAGAFDDALKIYAAPLSVNLGDGFTPEGLAAELQSAGYANDSSEAPETFSYRGSDFK